MNPQTPPPAPQNPPEPDSTPLKTDIVGNIPMHHDGAPPAPIKDGDDLDKIMQDVGHELKKDDKKPSGHHFFSKKHDETPPAPAHPPAAGEHQSAAKSQANPKPEHKAPVAVIVVTILVTVVLIGLTYSIYSK